MKKGFVLFLTLILLTGCTPSPAPEGTQTNAAASQSADTTVASTNLGPVWGRPFTDVSPVPDLNDDLAENYRFYEGNWYLEGYTDVSLTVSFDETGKMYIASWNYCFNKDVTYPLYAMMPGKESYMLEITEDNLEQQKSDYGLSFEAGCIVVRGRRFYRDRKPRMTEAECSAFVQPYLGPWYMEGYGDVTVTLLEEKGGLVVISHNFSLRDRFHFQQHGAFTVYPQMMPGTSYVTAVIASYSDWEQELACHHLTLRENQITIGGYVFVRTPGTKTKDNQ